MNRDADIQRIFEVADDSLQGVLGYHLYVIAAQQEIDIEKTLKHLPDLYIPHTFSWVRAYQKQDLISAFRPPIFEIFQSRISLIAMANVFEVALANFVTSLNEKEHQQFYGTEKLKGDLSYKRCLEWAYDQSTKCDIGDQAAIGRLPKTFGIIDNARRLRNLIVHNHGLFNKKYEEDAIRTRGILKDLHPHYQKIFLRNTQRPTPVIILNEDTLNFSRAHIEVLHVLHNCIQKEYFGFTEPYSYLREKKGIEWNKVLWGSARVEVLRPKQTISQ